MNRLVLEIFPGASLFGEAFERAGFTVVRGPDLLWGGDVHRFHVPPGVFAGLIGGPPCQRFSQSQNIAGVSERADLIPEYVRIWREGRFQWSVMENVNAVFHVHAQVNGWHPAQLRDWDCGGETARKRSFWTWPFMMLEPPPRAGAPSLSVLASTAKRGGTDSSYAHDKRFLPGNLPLEEYERLQGVPGRMAEFTKAGASKLLAVHMLGNGVPMAMGQYVAREVERSMYEAVPA